MMIHAGLGVVVLACSVGAVAWADDACPPCPADAVCPTGDAAADVAAVQAALAAGGTVFLRARDACGEARAFEFGTSGTALIKSDVIVLGEDDGGARTTIHGGRETLTSPVPQAGQVPPSVWIEGIRFEGARLAAVAIKAATTADVIDNEIVGTIAALDGATSGPQNTPLPPVARPIIIGPALPGPTSPGPKVQVMGRVRVEGNVIDGAPGAIGSGVFVLRTDGDVTISGNTITGTDREGIRVIQSPGAFTIDSNAIAPTPWGPTATGFRNGILLNGNVGGEFAVTDNAIWLRSRQGDALFALNGGTMIVTGNVLHIDPRDGAGVALAPVQTGGITLGGNVSGAYVARNRITGRATYGFTVQGTTAAPNVGNTFQANDIAGLALTPWARGTTHVYLAAGARDTTVVGFSGHVVDLGTGNRITGYSTRLGAEGLGASLSDAIHAAQDLYDALAE